MLSLWGPVVAWAAAIFMVSSLSLGGGGGGVPDWLSHGGVYAVLSLLLCRALAGGFGLPLSWRGAVLAAVIGTAYGVSDEWHQAFVPERHSTAADVAKDAAGAVLGALAYRLATPRRRSPQRSLASHYRSDIHPRRGAE